MNSKLQILGAVIAMASCSFLQTPNQFQSTFNSTFLTRKERLFKPIFIPNITKHSEHLQDTTTRAYESHKTAENEEVLKEILQPQEISQESIIRENYSEELKTTGNPLKFSSRYSTKDEDLSKEKKAPPEANEILAGIESLPRTTEKSDLPEANEIKMASPESKEVPNEKKKSFSDRLDDLEDSEEAEHSYKSSDPDESKHTEESIKLTPPTDESYLESPKPTSFRKYSEENFETTSNAIKHIDKSEEEETEEEDKRSVDDYYNSGSKNYHSIQTPLNQIKYRGPLYFKDDFESEKVRTRLVSPIDRRPYGPSWPREKTEFEKLNEISDSDESYEKTLDEGVKKEVKIKFNQEGLELAVEKDELKFQQNNKYSLMDERNRRTQQQKSLEAEEDKDVRRPLFKSLKQYQVDEKEHNHQQEPNLGEEDISNFKTDEGIWPTRPPSNIFKVIPTRQPKKFNISNELTHNFQNYDSARNQFLGPIVFSHNSEQETVKTALKPQKQNILSKGLSKSEKLIHRNLSDQKFQKTIVGTGSLETQSFNYLEESDEMYNAILANIQSVFGMRVQPGKSGSGSEKEAISKVNSDEAKSLTWSLPLIKREKVN